MNERLQGRITDIEPIIVHVSRRGDWVFLQVHTDIGLTGLGEASHSLNDALLLAAVNVFRERLIGRSPFQIEGIRQDLARLDGGRVTHTALSAVEQALWDILGQRLGVPIHALLGGALRERIRLYANINRHVTDRSPEGFAHAARQAVSEGFTAVKMARAHFTLGERREIMGVWMSGEEWAESKVEGSQCQAAASKGKRD